jgi:hypothetical protein
MTAPDQIPITHAQPMTRPRAALTSDDIPPDPLSEDDLRQQWWRGARLWVLVDRRQRAAKAARQLQKAGEAKA